jgi:hypothetical protein
LGKEDIMAEQKPKRLVPKPDVLRELYLLSGNNCAMPECNNVIVDSKGVVIGQVCHIEAASPRGPRFNAKQSNDDRRSLSNLVLICAGHHIQIDSKKYEKQWSVAAVRKLKRNHEKQFKGIDNSLQQAFKTEFVDTTDALNPTSPGKFRALEDKLPDCILDEEDAPKREVQVNEFVENLRKVPTKERDFILGVIRRAIKLGDADEVISVHVDDIVSAFGMGHTKLKTLGKALERYGVGDIDLVSSLNSHEDEYHVRIYNPSEYLFWFDIAEFCEKSDLDLERIVVDLKFGFLDAT